jgi:hypothetical protein
MEARFNLSIALPILKTCSLIMCALGGAIARFYLGERVSALHQQITNLTRYADEQLDWRKYEAALVAGEDHRYSYHFGLDPIAIARAILQTCVFGRLQGGSTIEQQLTRTLTGDYRRSLSRKISEALLASTLFGCFTKEELARAYLASAHFGYGMRGIREALISIRIPEEISHLAVPYVIGHLRYPQRMQDREQDIDRRIARAKYIMRRSI